MKKSISKLGVLLLAAGLAFSLQSCAKDTETSKNMESTQQTSRATSEGNAVSEAVTVDSVNASLQDVYFDFDRYNLTASSESRIARNAQAIRQLSGVSVTVSGYCDERGTTEYNLALGAKRANSVKNALVAQGIAAGSIKTVSYGEENAVCHEQNESCYKLNRRGHTSVK